MFELVPNGLLLDIYSNSLLIPDQLLPFESGLRGRLLAEPAIGVMAQQFNESSVREEQNLPDIMLFVNCNKSQVESEFGSRFASVIYFVQATLKNKLDAIIGIWLTSGLAKTKEFNSIEKR